MLHMVHFIKDGKGGALDAFCEDHVTNKEQFVKVRCLNVDKILQKLYLRFKMADVLLNLGKWIFCRS